MNGELGINICDESVDQAYGSPDSDNDGVTNDQDFSARSHVPNGRCSTVELAALNASNTYNKSTMSFVSGDYTLSISSESSSEWHTWYDLEDPNCLRVGFKA